MKIIRKSNFRVVVEPRRLGDYGAIRTSDTFCRTEEQVEIDYIQRCNEIVDDIKRHVDNIGNVSIEHDTDSICSHCNLTWEISETDSDPNFQKGCPMCCNKAIEEWENAKNINA